MSAARFVNIVTHLCGCETRFDTLHWRSEVTRPCADHTCLISGDSGP